MNNLWAPWRMEFIEGLRDKGGGCIFCELNGQGDDRERLVLCRLPHAYVVMNRFPYNNGHLLIVPKRHEGCLAKLDDDESSELMHLNAQSIEILRKVLTADGVNSGINIGQAAGAGITDHLHIHG